MSFLDPLLRKILQIAGVSLTERARWNFVSGATAVDNPTTKATDIIIAGQGGTPLANAGTGALPNVVTVDASGYPVSSVRFSGAAPSVSGFASGTAGRVLRVTATGGPLVLVNQATSTAANRIITSTGGNVTIADGGNAELVYDGTTARWRLTIDGIAGSSTPTGTGLIKVVAGVQDAATSLLVNADVDAAAAIALTKIVNPTGTGIVKTTAGAIDAAASLIVNANVDAAAAVAGTKVSPDFGAQDIQTSGSISAGSPIIGLASPYGVHGAVISAMTDADYVVPAGEYIYDLIEVPAALTLTANRNFDLPLPASEATSYEKEVSNINTSIFSLVIRVAGGAGATVTLLVGTRGTIRIRPGGVYLQAPAL